ncbi:hypothetical protein ACGFWD_27115 [Streptomyces sp. NPDC048448]|uniref:hypothetical protein n=1 Tax=Streptomyces sp. NPDC048448 TaxID=3365554 RepID=UPI00371665BE
MTKTQLEAALFRLGILGLIAPRSRGEAVRLVASHIAWDALHQLTNLHSRIADTVREQVLAHLHPAPDYLALSGAVIEGTASHSADVLELIIVRPTAGPVDWEDGVTALLAQVSCALGNVVVHRAARDTQEAEAMGGKSAVRIIPRSQFEVQATQDVAWEVGSE